MAGLLDNITSDAPALWQAQRISETAVDAGFEWDSVEDVWAKVEEEIAEFNAAPEGSHEKIEEFGDVLFTLVNVARKEGIDAEEALQLACDKFRTRWQAMEEHADKDLGSTINEVERDQLESLWNQVKEELAG